MTPPSDIVFTGSAWTPPGSLQTYPFGPARGWPASLPGPRLGAVGTAAAVERPGLAADAVTHILVGTAPGERLGTRERVADIRAAAAPFAVALGIASA